MTDTEAQKEYASFPFLRSAVVRKRMEYLSPEREPPKTYPLGIVLLNDDQFAREESKFHFVYRTPNILWNVWESRVYQGLYIYKCIKRSDREEYVCEREESYKYGGLSETPEGVRPVLIFLIDEGFIENPFACP